MSVSFHSVDPNPDHQCSVCHEITMDSVVAHDDAGDLHPIHEKCIKLWAARHNTCPDCRATIDTDSLFSTKDKAINFIKIKIFEDVLQLREDPLYAIVPTIAGALAGTALMSAAENPLGDAAILLAALTSYVSADIFRNLRTGPQKIFTAALGGFSMSLISYRYAG